MLTLTDTAKHEIAKLIEGKDEENLSLRVVVSGRRFGRFMYQLGFIGPDDRKDDDIVVDADEFEVIVDADSAESLEGATVDFVTTENQRGFSIENPNPVWADDTSQAIQELLDSDINPALASHGGVVSLVEVKENVAYIAFGGGCQGCGMVDVTLKQGVEVRLKDAMPELDSVVDITDHSSGDNPFYK